MATSKSPLLHFAFDIGHSSIGWAVLSPGSGGQSLEIHGCGVLIFPADDCLASKRRDFRRQRRHIRATRQRVARIKALLAHLGVLTREQLNGVVSSSPWALAARVLRGGKTLTWRELWDVLRWYAHNRGYDGNRRWSGSPEEAAAEEEDTQKVKNAHELMEKHGASSMAETFCSVLGVDPLSEKLSSQERFKGVTNAAFPRAIVTAELRRLFRAHAGVLPKVDEALERALLGGEFDERDDDWRAIPCPAIRLPLRFKGSLLLGQTVPRFDNRLIATCPITFQRELDRALAEGLPEDAARRRAEKLAKVPNKETQEFYRFRWAMEVAKIKLHGTQPLTIAQRQALDVRLRAQGSFTAAEFKKAVRTLTGTDARTDNLDQILLHPDAAKALVLDPVQREIASGTLSHVWPLLPEDRQKRIAGRLRKGKAVTLAETVAGVPEAEAEARTAFAQRSVKKAAAKKSAKNQPAATPPTYEEWAVKPITMPRLSGRAPYARTVLKEVDAFVFTADPPAQTDQPGRHPMDPGGPLFRSQEIIARERQRKLDDQINNHLIRHRLLLLDRLHRDLLLTYADADPSHVARIAIEVNRDLREFAGMTRKDIEGDLNSRLRNFNDVVKKIEDAGLTAKPGLIRKARIAEDLGWECPFTGAIFDPVDLTDTTKVDKDHIIPRSLRPSDGLDSLIITFPEVNRMKGQRTAYEFVEQEQGKIVPGLPNLTIRSLTQYKKHVESLESFKGHDDDKKRKRRRKELLLLPSWTEKGFVPRDLTQTSQIVRLGAEVLVNAYAKEKRQPVVTSLPGSVTGAVRKGWDLLGCLSAVCPQMTAETTKTDIRSMTHMHHALDAVVVGLADLFFPKNDTHGSVWELMTKRQLSEADQARLRHATRQLYGRRPEGRFGLLDLDPALKNQIRQKLAERRVVQHIPADMSGLKADQTVYRVLDLADPHPSTQKLLRWAAAAGVKIPPPDDEMVLITARKRKDKGVAKPSKLLRETDIFYFVYDIVAKSKLIGLEPPAGAPARLKKQKAVKVLGDNYGLALDPEPTIIRNFRVWPQIRQLTERNGGKPPRILRQGQVISVESGTYAGTWRVFSVKNNASGIAIDMGWPDVIALKNKTEGHRINVLVASLKKAGVKI